MMSDIRGGRNQKSDVGKKMIASRKIYLLIGLFISISLSFITSSVINPSHNASEILIDVDGFSMTLQEAMDGGFLKDGGGSPTKDYTTSIAVGHLGNDIKIYIGEKISLRDAVANRAKGKSFCRDPPGVFSWAINLGHSADKIIFKDGETLQYKINSQKFCGYTWEYGSTWVGCTAATCSTCSDAYTSSGTETRSALCKRSDGKTRGITDADCVGDGQGEKISSQGCHINCPNTITYDWKEDGWIEPANACGTATQHVWCEKCEGIEEPFEGYCGMTSKPVSSAERGGSSCGWNKLGDIWENSWDDCRATCGTRTRTCNVAGHCVTGYWNFGKGEEQTETHSCTQGINDPRYTSYRVYGDQKSADAYCPAVGYGPLNSFSKGKTDGGMMASFTDKWEIITLTKEVDYISYISCELPSCAICDPATQLSPNWGVKDGVCRASCGGLGGTACISSPCSGGLIDAGISYDCPYCCKS